MVLFEKSHLERMLDFSDSGHMDREDHPSSVAMVGMWEEISL